MRQTNISPMFTTHALVSIISGWGRIDTQMGIPSAFLNSNGDGIKIIASCRENRNDVPKYNVNYDDWKNNKVWRLNSISG